MDNRNYDNNGYNQGYYNGSNPNLGQSEPQDFEVTFDQYEQYVGRDAAQEGMRAIMERVFVQLFIGLLITAVVSMGMANFGITLNLISSIPFFHIIVFVVQFIAVIAFSATLFKVSPAVSTMLFMAYAILMGVTLSVIYYIYAFESILYTFGITALIFAAMAIWGHTTKRDLSKMGSILMMFLIGAIIVTIANIFLAMVFPAAASAIDMVLNYVVLAIFIGLVAYDMQKIKTYAVALNAFGEDDTSYVRLQQVATNGAFELYLDFINIFIRLLSILGRRK